MESTDEFLKKTECHFNWRLFELEVDPSVSVVEKFRNKVNESDLIGDLERVWHLKLNYAFELFKTDQSKAKKITDEVIDLVLTSNDDLNKKYRTPMMHIVYSCKALMLLKSNELGEILKVTEKIKPWSSFSPEEISCVLAVKAEVLRWYGPHGTKRAMPVLREAIKYNPSEPEWKLSLVVCMNRKRHYLRDEVTNCWESVQEPINIIEDLLNQPDLTLQQRLSCKHFLAVAYHDYATGKYWCPEITECRDQVVRLCSEICDLTEHPQVLAFCVDRFLNDNNNTTKGEKLLKAALSKFPNHVALNVSACKMYKNYSNFPLAAKHAQIALDGGGFGAAWFLLECKTKLREVINGENYFDHLLANFPEMYKIHIHLRASLFYFYYERDRVLGASHMYETAKIDPSNKILHRYYCNWANAKICPLEVAYNQIMFAMRTNRRPVDFATLRAAKEKIEEISDVSTFCRTRDLVHEALKEKGQTKSKDYRPRASVGDRPRTSKDGPRTTAKEESRRPINRYHNSERETDFPIK